MRQRTAVLMVAVSTVLGPARMARGSADIIDRVLAVVAGEVITLSDVSGAIALGLVEITGAGDPLGAALTRWIERTLILNEVNRYATPEPDASLVSRALERVRARFTSAEAFATTLAAAGMDGARLRGLIRDALRIQVYLDQRFAGAAQPTDQDVDRYYRAHRAEFVKDGKPLSLEEADPLVRARLATERRLALVADWVAGLRRRADVTEIYLPGRQGARD